MMMRMRVFYPLMAALLLFSAGERACAQEQQPLVLPAVPDYAESTMWYAASSAEAVKEADVFYVAPTCTIDWTNEAGETVHFMDPTRASQRRMVDGAHHVAAALFGKHCRFYAPYYRQITMNSWRAGGREVVRRFAIAFSDIERAFRYYMEHENKGRPFFLAGHSQGAKMIVELLKHTLTEEQHARMVAAYAFGFSIARSEVEQSPLLRPAEGATDLGVTISFNSVSRPEAATFRTAVCINPVNWRTDERYAAPEENLGSLFFRGGQVDTLCGRVGVRLDRKTNNLIIDGLDDEKFHLSAAASLFPKGNYHAYELNLYFLNVQQNVGERIAAYRKQHP